LVGMALAIIGASTVTCGGTSSPARACVPGASVACTGPAGCTGFQVCNAGGSALGPCDCASGADDTGPDAGPMSGESSSSSSSSGGAITCTSAAACEPGQVCCGTVDLTSSCQAGPCPMQQWCAGVAECLEAVATCGPSVEGEPSTCNASSSGCENEFPGCGSSSGSSGGPDAAGDGAGNSSGSDSGGDSSGSVEALDASNGTGG
jgi:hypothetical protein